MKAKEYLQQVRKANAMINNKQCELDSLNCLAYSITSRIKEDVVQTSGVSDKVGDTVAKIVDLQNEINSDIDRFVELKKEIMGVIDRLDSPLSDLLYKRYFRFETWEQISIDLGYSYLWVCGKVRGKPGLHIQALKEVQKIIDRQY